jgi:hypothetical protein
MTALPLILSTHVDREPALDAFDLAFARLGRFLYAELGMIEALGRALSLQHLGRSISALHLLHRGGSEPDPVVIKTAIEHLADLRDLLLAIPSRAEVINPQAIDGVISLRDVDAAIRFAGARVDEQIAALVYALRDA